MLLVPYVIPTSKFIKKFHGGPKNMKQLGLNATPFFLRNETRNKLEKLQLL